MSNNYVLIKKEMREGKTMYAARMMERMRNLGIGFCDPLPDNLLWDIKKIPLIIEQKQRNKVKSARLQGL